MSKRAFIIGNGPSLDWTPMDDLIGEDTFAMNRIHLLWNRRRLLWRPTYYFAWDWTGPTMEQDVMNNYAQPNAIVITRKDLQDRFPRMRIDFEWPTRFITATPCGIHTSTNISRPERMPKKWHLPMLCGFGSTLNVAMQSAVIMGYDELYLLGCDLGFVPEPEDGPGLNHFDPTYRTYDDHPLEERDATLIRMHEIAKKACAERGVKVYNATLGGILEVYPRVDLQEVLA